MMKRIEPKDTQRLGEIVAEYNEITTKYKIPTVLAFSLDDSGAMLKAGGTTVELLALVTCILKYLKNNGIDKELIKKTIVKFV